MKRILVVIFIVLAELNGLAQISKKDSIASIVNFNQNSEKLKKFTKIDSLYFSIQKAKEDSNKVIALNLLSWELAYTGNNNASFELANEAITLSEKIKYKKGYLGAYNALANVYSHTGNHSEAIKKYFSTLKISEELNYKNGIANAYNNIGSVYFNTGNYKEALINFKAALKISTEINFKKVIAIAYENIGIINQIGGDYDEALKNHLASLKIREQMGDKRAISWSYQNLAIDYASQKKYGIAQEYFMKALQLQEQAGDKFEMCRIYVNIGELFIEQKKYKEALELCEKGLAIANEINFQEMGCQIEKVISEIYEAMGNPIKALEHYKKYKVAKDSVENNENDKKIVRAEMNYKFEKQRQEEKILLAKKEARIIEELKYQKVLWWSGILGVILVASIAFILLVNYRRKIKTNNLIALQKEEISRQKAGIEGQEEERNRISKELHDGLGGSLAAIKLNLERIGSLEKGHSKEIEKIISNVSEACKEVRTISHNLSPFSITNNLLLEALQDLVSKFNVPGKLSISLECFPEKEINKVSQEVKNELYRITQECLNNIVKHANANRVNIGMLVEENYLYLSIEDNGKGFDSASIKKGIGLKNIKTRVDLLKGDISIDSKAGRGTAINIKLKV
ncbi:MAG: sensor histidine kinase [Sphingobacteriaceae bacterium]|nr:sensor histidine kinase [Sphingobacteriaceae bacterium]